MQERPQPAIGSAAACRQFPAIASLLQFKVVIGTALKHLERLPRVCETTGREPDRIFGYFGSVALIYHVTEPLPH